jgi:hypothetical protein
MWKGWQPYDTTFDYGGIGDPLGGACRSLHRHVDISNTTWVSVGCAHRFYMWRDGTSHEVTPVQSTQAGLSNPFATTNGSSIVTVTDTSHGQIQGNIVVFSGASTVASILDTTINRTQGWSIASTVDANSYTIDFGTSASATTSGGGTVTATYLIQPGSDDAVAGGGWGSLSWGEEEWGGDDALSIGERLGIWSQDNWGEDLVANPQGGAIYYWDATSPSARMVNILNLGSADGFAPISADFILVSYESRQLIAFGATEYSSGTANHMNIRWSDQEDILTWNDAATTNAAGSKALALGTKLISAIHGTGEIVVWSDTTTYSMKFIGAPYMFSFDIIEQTSDIIGLKACATLGSTVFWVGRSGVYAYSGRVQKLECPVWDYLDSRCNWQQASKVIACTNRLYNEVLFFYPSSDGNEIDSYISYDQTLITDCSTQEFHANNERRSIQHTTEKSTEHVQHVAKETIGHICRDCGREVENIFQDVCGRQDCEQVAAIGQVRMALEVPDEQFATALFAQYRHDPRTQIVMDKDPQNPDAPLRTKEPNLMSVMWSIADGAISEADAYTVARAEKYCADFRGV